MTGIGYRQTADQIEWWFAYSMMQIRVAAVIKTSFADRDFVSRQPPDRNTTPRLPSITG